MCLWRIRRGGGFSAAESRWPVNMFGISNDIAMQVVAVGFIIGVLQDSCETALNSSTDVLFTAAACQAEDERLANSALRN